MAPANEPTVEIANQADIPKYVEFAQAAQAFIRAKGLGQWVPPAHSGFLPDIEARVHKRTLHKVSRGEDAIAFFDFSFEPSAWWTGRVAPAGYISGIVVARESRGLGVGRFILEYAEAKARNGGVDYLRLDCHAENIWLCEYYRSYGFAEAARIEQFPGYRGVLYQKLVLAADSIR